MTGRCAMFREGGCDMMAEQSGTVMDGVRELASDGAAELETEAVNFADAAMRAAWGKA